MSNRCNSVGGHGEGQGLGGADSGGSGSERGLLWPMEGEGRNQRATAQQDESSCPRQPRWETRQLHLISGRRRGHRCRNRGCATRGRGPVG
jgi:hypothetical protein